MKNPFKNLFSNKLENKGKEYSFKAQASGLPDIMLLTVECDGEQIGQAYITRSMFYNDKQLAELVADMRYLNDNDIEMALVAPKNGGADA